MSDTDQPVSEPKQLKFLDSQIKEYGGKVEIDGGYWTLFAVPAADDEANAIAALLLRTAKFAHDTGSTEDDRWTLYYVDTANRAAAIHWLHDSRALLAGGIRPVSPAQTALINDLAGSNMPHRLAQQLGEMHGKGELSAGAVSDPNLQRVLLDRLHMMEPLFFAAFQSLLANNLLDLVVLLKQMIPEDIHLENQIVKSGLSRDPFLQSRQNAASEIRGVLIRFCIINPIDQQKNAVIANPYSAYMELDSKGDEITTHIDGNKALIPREHFLKAIHTTRRNLYRGGQFADFNTQVPWMNEDIAHSFRYIKQRLETRREVSAMDGLYMIERAIER